MGKAKRAGTIVLRVIALLATACAAIVMVSSREETRFLVFVTYEVKYSYIPAFKYFLIANAIGAFYSLLVLFLPSQSLLWKLVFAIDAVITIVLTSSLSAALAIALVGKEGILYAGWQPICGFVGNFCDRITVALVAGAVGVIAYLFLVLCSVHSMLDPLLLQGN